MSIAFDVVTDASGVSTHTGSVSPVTCPAAGAGFFVDDVLVCTVQDSGTSATIATPTGWTLLEGPVVSSTHTSWMFARICDATPADDFSAVITGPSQWLADMAAYNGCDISNGVTSAVVAHANNFGAAAETTHVGPSVTTTIDGCAIVTLFTEDSVNNPHAWSNPVTSPVISGPAIRADVNEGTQKQDMGIADAIGAVASTAYTFSLTLASAEVINCICVVLAPVAGGVVEPGFQRPIGLKLPNRMVGPQVLRFHYRKPIPFTTEVITTADPTIWGILQFPPGHGPMVIRKRRTRDFQFPWDSSSGGNVNLVLTAIDTLNAISDTAVRASQSFARTAADTLAAISDIANRLIALPRTAADSLGAITESIVSNVRLPRTASDSLGAISDSAVRASQSFTRTASDSLAALSDVATRLIALPRTAADTLAAITEATAIQKGVTRTASDTLSAISDSATRQAQAFTRTASDSLAAISDTATRVAQAFLRTASDSLSAITEATTIARGVSRTASDTLGAISDSAIRASMSKVRTASDALGAMSDSAVRAAQSFLRTASDTLNAISEATTTARGISRTASDTLGAISDSAVRASQSFTRTATDTLNAIGDSAIRTAQSSSRLAADSLGAITEATTVARGISRTAADTIGALSDSAIRVSASKIRTAADTLNTLSDSATRQGQSFARTASDVLASISDAANIPAALTIFISFMVYGRSGIATMAGRVGSMLAYGRSGFSKIPSYSSYVLSLGPVAYWRLNETTGLVANDISGNGLNGAIGGGVTQGSAGLVANDPADSAMQFDGISGKIDVPFNVLLNPSQFTIVAWFKKTSTPPSNDPIIDCRPASSGATAAGFDLFFNVGASIGISICANNVSQTLLTGSPAIPNGETHFTGASYDGTAARLYIDGALNKGPTNCPFTPNPNKVSAIGHLTGGVNFSPAVLDEIALFPRKLSDAEMANLFAIGSRSPSSAILSMVGRLGAMLNFGRRSN